MFTERDISNPQAGWVLTDVADNTTRGSVERVKEKMTKMSSLSHNLGEMKQDLEKALEEADRRSQIAEARRMSAEQDRQEAEKSRQEAERGRQVAERSRKESELDRAEAENIKQEAEDKAIAAERRAHETEKRVTEAEKRAQAAEERFHDTEKRLHVSQKNLILSEERVHEVERKRQEAENKRAEAERRVQESEMRVQEAEIRGQQSEKRSIEAEHACQEAELKRQEASAKEVSVRQALHKCELEREESDRKLKLAKRAEDEVGEKVKEVEERLQGTDEQLQLVRQQLHEAQERATRSAREAEEAMQEVRLQLQQAEQRARDSEERLVQEQALRARQAIQGSEHKDQQWLVNRQEINLTKEKLGKGGWAKVQVAEFRGIKVAAKKLYKELQSPFYHNAFTREMNMAARVRHPNLVQFIGACMDEEMIILLELMPTSLRKYLADCAPARPSASFCTSACMDVAKALNYLHLMQPDPIVHRDISCANVLLEPLPGDQWRAKVTDYGSANLQSQLQTRNPGNPVYSAPESGDKSQQSPQMDIFSFGILMITMWTAEFPEVSKRETLISSIRDRHCISLLRACLRANRANRPSAARIIAELLTWQQ